MDRSARESYLEAQILTATPQKLRLMLIDAAVGAARQTLDLWDQGQNEDAVEALIRCRNIISELLSGIRPDKSELSRRVMGIYVFLFKALTEAQLRRDRATLLEAIRVLEIERETWRQVCHKVPQHMPSSDEKSPDAAEITADDAQRLLDRSVDGEAPSSGGLVLDA